MGFGVKINERAHFLALPPGQVTLLSIYKMGIITTTKNLGSTSYIPSPLAQ